MRSIRQIEQAKRQCEVLRFEEVVDQPGGKSLVLAMTAIAVGGITVIIFPLLALTANQLTRVNAAVQRYVTVAAVHIDKTSDNDLRCKAIQKMDVFDKGSSSSLLLQCSPQELAKNTVFRNAVF